MEYVNTFLKQLSPAQMEYLNTCIYKSYKAKVTEEVSNYDNLENQIHCCPNCKSMHFIKYGKTKYGRQKYQCKECHCIFGVTTNTFFYHSKIKFHEWLHFIASEINKLTLEEEMVAIGRSKTTCFHMRHKLYASVHSFQEEQMLGGQVQLDPFYLKINLKGTKTKNMPRISKPRGKKQTSQFGKNLAGISHHKVCVFSAIDENDNIVMKIAGLGSESLDLLTPFHNYFKGGSTIISDNKACIKNFANEQELESEPIPTKGNQKRYTTEKGNSLGDINQLHQEVSEMLVKKHGVSIRHLQGYLDWLVFCKKLKYTVEAKQRRINAYLQIMTQPIDITKRTMCTKELPINLYEAYKEYHYGIFA